ncbi:hypothetical protein [Heliorestis convoluta]|uniref:Uncharacterized protein n=1 Tax=Heliorestis convoluta TaxID=356322 RepID=A0A5Q2N0C5_9FIRM|nr:hypothetical protein [Heliorestis convoluta]QGG47741.1 hypothetical protein FTV88_1642 [Heliorestis convoluta]
MSFLLKKMLLLLSIALVIVTFPQKSYGEEQIVFSGSQANAFDRAMEIEDLSKRTLIYGNFSVKGQRDFFQVKAQKGETVNIEMAIPQVDALNTFRPSFFLVGPDLPTYDELPFFLPLSSDYGAYKVMPSEQEKDYLDPMTGNLYWITQAFQYPITTTGDYYIIVYDEKKQEGKYLLKIGQKEEKYFYQALLQPINFLAFRSWYNPLQVLIPLALIAMAGLIFIINIIKRKH